MKIVITILSVICIASISFITILLINNDSDAKTNDIYVSNLYSEEDVVILDELIEIDYDIMKEYNMLVFILNNDTGDDINVDLEVKYFDNDDNLVKSEVLLNGAMKIDEENVVFSYIPIMYSNYAGKIEVSPIVTEHNEFIPDHDVRVDVSVSKEELFKSYSITSTIANDSNSKVSITGYNVLYNGNDIVGISNFSVNELDALSTDVVVEVIYPFDDNYNDIEYISYDRIKTFINEVYYFS